MSSYETELQKEREAKDQFMARHPESPFVIGEVPAFEGLHYFPIDPSFRVEARLRRLEHPEEVILRTNRDEEMTCRHVGDMVFQLDGQEHSLRVFHAGEQVGPSVFIPFRDATCGLESYGPGRYLILQLTEDDRYTLDFNLSFNPYCAYTDRFECGFPPSENDIAVPIRAGEMAWVEEDPNAVVMGPEVDERPAKRAHHPAPVPAPEEEPPVAARSKPTPKSAPKKAPAPPGSHRPPRAPAHAKRSKH